MTDRGYNVFMFVLLGNIYVAKQGVLDGLYFLSGYQLQFNCFYRQSSYKLVSFEHNGSVVSPDFSRRYHIVVTAVGYVALVVSDTQPDDAGFWGCTIEDQIVGNQITVYAEVRYRGGWHC